MTFEPTKKCYICSILKSLRWFVVQYMLHVRGCWLVGFAADPLSLEVCMSHPLLSEGKACMVRLSERKRLIADLQHALVLVASNVDIHIPLAERDERNEDVRFLIALRQHNGALLRVVNVNLYRLWLHIPKLFGCTSLNGLLGALHVVFSNRYLTPRLYTVPKNTSPFNFICSLDDGRFRQEARMSQASFWMLTIWILDGLPLFTMQEFGETVNCDCA